MHAAGCQKIRGDLLHRQLCHAAFERLRRFHFLAALRTVADVVLKLEFCVIRQLIIDEQDNVLFCPFALHKLSPRNHLQLRPATRLFSAWAPERYAASGSPGTTYSWLSLP